MNGLTTIQSRFGPKETMDRLEADVRAQGIRIFARINHAELAAATGQALEPTELLLFGNPRVGTPLMQAKQTIGIDLPLRILVWQDASNGTWITYNEPEWLAKRHNIGVETERIAEMMALALSTMAKKAAEPS